MSQHGVPVTEWMHAIDRLTAELEAARRECDIARAEVDVMQGRAESDWPAIEAELAEAKKEIERRQGAHERTLALYDDLWLEVERLRSSGGVDVDALAREIVADFCSPPQCDDCADLATAEHADSVALDGIADIIRRHLTTQQIDVEALRKVRDEIRAAGRPNYGAQGERLQRWADEIDRAIGGRDRE